jgi:hypothetical protein
VDSDAVKGEMDHQNGRAAYYHEEKTGAPGRMIFERKKRLEVNQKKQEKHAYGEMREGPREAKRGKDKGNKVKGVRVSPTLTLAL